MHPAHKLKLVKLPSHIRKSSKPREKLGSMSFVFLTLILHSIKDVVGSNSALEKKGDPLCWGEHVAMSCKSIPKVEDSTSTPTHLTDPTLFPENSFSLRTNIESTADYKSVLSRN